MAQLRPVERPRATPAYPPPRPVASDPGLAAFRILHVAFTALPLLAGIDKFLGGLGPWRGYLAPDIADLLGVSSQALLRGVGALEIAAGVIVAVEPRVGGWLVAGWLWAIVANLLLLPGYYDIALRDLTLSLGAVALARLAPPGGRGRRR